MFVYMYMYFCIPMFSRLFPHSLKLAKYSLFLKWIGIEMPTPGTDVMVLKIFSPKKSAKKLSKIVENCDYNIDPSSSPLIWVQPNGVKWQTAFDQRAFDQFPWYQYQNLVLFYLTFNSLRIQAH
jgi:hypothetical protein